MQRAARGELAFDDASPDATAVLTLSGVAPYTTWCARAVRAAPSAQTSWAHKSQIYRYCSPGPNVTRSPSVRGAAQQPLPHW